MSCLQILDVSSNSLTKLGPASVANLRLLKDLDLKLDKSWDASYLRLEEHC